MTIAKYPVDENDSEGIQDAINYLLSGPAGLGQNFAGFSTYETGYLRPDTREPFVVPEDYTPTQKIYQFYYITNAEGCDETGTPAPGVATNFVLITFSGVFTDPPYAPGDLVELQNVIDDFPTPPSTTSFDGTYRCWSCTTTNMVLYYRFQQLIWPTYISGGIFGADWRNFRLTTDCAARVTVNGAGDRVFINAQLEYSLPYLLNSVPSEFDIVIEIVRYRAVDDTSPGAIDFVFTDPQLVSRKIFHYDVSTDGVAEGEAVFTSIIDGPDLPFDYYRYFLEFSFVTQPTYRKSYAVGPISDADLLFTTSGTGVTQSSTIYTNLVPTTLTGSGSGLDIDLEINTTNSDQYVREETVFIDAVNNYGSGYRVGDQLLILGTDIGGASPANDMTLTVAQIDYPGFATIEPGLLELGLRTLTAQVVKQ